MENTDFGFEHLELWKKARILKNEIIKEARSFPTEEKFRLTDQLIRSSRSFNALIAEGHGRFTYADQTHFCVQARGSLSETINHLIDALDETYITIEQLNYFKQKAKEVEKMTNGYISYLRSKKEAEQPKKNTK
jgi:four helix bundle protein